MNLDQLLSSLPIERLQDMLVVWAPEHRLPNSKMQLFRVLRSEMTRPDRAKHCLDLAEPLGRKVIRKLLRSRDTRQSVAVLAASSSPRPRSVQETRETVADLAAMGLVYVEPEKRWETYGSAQVAVPDELVEPLRSATGIDDRAWREILSLRDHLAMLSEEERREQARKFDLDPDGSIDDLVAQLCTPGACAGRLGSVTPDVRRMILSVVREHAGLRYVEQLWRDLGLRLPEVREAAAESWRGELEAGLLGTVGDMSLLEYGVDLDGRALVVFGEVVEALLSAPCDGEIELTDPVGPDFLLDLSELVASTRKSGARLKTSGALTAASADRINRELNRPELPLADAGEMLEFRLSCAEKLGLVERRGKTLAVRRRAWEWEQRSYEEKAGDLFGLVGFAVPSPRSEHHHEGLCTAARDLMQSLPPGAWRPARSLANIGVRRYLAGLDEADLRDQISAAVRGVSEYVLPPFPGVNQLTDDVHRAVTFQAYIMGLLDVAPDADEAERLSEFGSVAVGQTDGRKADGELIATPDFEVVILPEGDTTRLRYEVGQFAALQKFEQTYHMKITRERTEEAVVRGLDPDRMINALRRYSRQGSIPQNVETSIREWAERVRVATVEEAVVLELADPGLLDVVAELPAMKDLTVRRISPNVLALRSWPSDRKLLAQLRRLGVFVR